MYIDENLARATGGVWNFLPAERVIRVIGYGYGFHGLYFAVLGSEAQVCMGRGGGIFFRSDANQAAPSLLANTPNRLAKKHLQLRTLHSIIIRR